MTSTCPWHSITHSLDLWQHIAEIQNHWQRTTGQPIERNNHALWAVLHGMSNEDWAGVLATFPTICDHYGIDLTPSQAEGYELALTTFETYCDELRRALDTNRGKIRNKPIQWRMIMILREVYNQISGTSDREIQREFERRPLL
jgi:dGTP triphosphohydrolase